MTLDFSRRGYAGGAPNTTLNGSITNSGTALTLTSGTGYPTANFLLVLDPGTASEEKVWVGSRSGTACTGCTRGVDGTTGVTHSSGAVVVHKGGAQDFDEANQIASALTTKGDLLVKGGTASVSPARLAVGADNTRLIAASGQSLGVQWVADTQNTVVDAAGDMLIGTADNTITKLATSGLTAFVSYTPTLTQSGTVTKTVTYAKYCQIGKLVIGQISLAVTGTGTGTNSIVVGAPPVTAATSSIVIGTAYVYDSSATAVYGGATLMLTTGTFSIVGLGGTPLVSMGSSGAAMTAAIASGDVIEMSFMYEAA